jgi:polyisoprenoid-binding protein YceI
MFMLRVKEQTIMYRIFSSRFLPTTHSVLVLAAALATASCQGSEAISAVEEPSAKEAAAPTEPDKPSVSIPVPAVPQTSKWELDPENSSAEFVCKHVLSKVRGMLPKPSGSVMLDEATPANSKINATIDVNSITTGVEERDTHLKSPDFFDVVKYPAITFVSTGVSRSSATSYSVTGNLTMHGVTKPVTLAVTVSPPFNHAGGIRRGIEATTSVNRKDFGLRWEFPGEGAGIVVGDHIQITINAELVLQPEPSKGR